MPETEGLFNPQVAQEGLKFGPPHTKARQTTRYKLYGSPYQVEPGGSWRQPRPPAPLLRPAQCSASAGAPCHQAALLNPADPEVGDTLFEDRGC